RCLASLLVDVHATKKQETFLIGGSDVAYARKRGLVNGHTTKAHLPGRPEALRINPRAPEGIESVNAAPKKDRDRTNHRTH
ncbi:MAG: hypothetical protein K0S10_1955, partial [Rubrobacteraceae bacterium]|nr:hypothetical protein [Rubrobacteraceae bacterium]